MGLLHSVVMKILTLEEIPSIAEIVSNFEELVKETFQFPKPLIEMIRDWMEAGNIQAVVSESDDGRASGLGVVVPTKERILVIYADSLDETINQEEINRNETKLLDWCLSQFKNPPAKVEFPKMTKNLKDELLKRGYKEYERASMKVSRDDFLKNQEIAIPDGFSLAKYDPEKRSKIAEVLAEANENHVDAIIYSEFFSSKEKGIEFLKKYEENAFGEYLEDFSKILLKDDEIIGHCLLSKEGKALSVPDIGLLPKYQGRGLGKALLVNTILTALKRDESIPMVYLGVTLTNPAKYLYEKVGFTIREYFTSIVFVGTG